MYDLKNIKSVQIEITERCNAACPACQRNYFGYGSRPGIYKGNMSLEQFKTLLTEELLSQLNEVFFCGNFGDAQLNPHLPDMIDYMYNVNPDLWLCINTNGSMHNKEYWENGTIPWLTSGEINFNRITSAEQKITKLGLDNSSARIFPKN